MKAVFGGVRDGDSCAMSLSFRPPWKQRLMFAKTWFDVVGLEREESFHILYVEPISARNPQPFLSLSDYRVSYTNRRLPDGDGTSDEAVRNAPPFVVVIRDTLTLKRPQNAML